MNVRRVRFVCFVIFKILLFVAGIISIKNQIWTNLILVIITFFLVYMNKILRLRVIKRYPNKLEIMVLLLIYLTIFIETTTFVKVSQLWFRVLFYLLISFVIGLVGFSLIYVLNKDERAMFHLNPFFVALFSFTFSVSIGAVW